MAFLKVKNRAISSLASGVSDTDTTWTVVSGEGSKFPDSGDFHVTCEDEIVKCTARSGDVLTVTRAQEETSAAAHSAGKAVELRVTAGVIENIQNEAIPKSLLTTQGDIIQRGASVPERLAIGTKRFFPRVNEAGNALEYIKGFEFGPKHREWQNELAFYNWTTAVTGSGAVVYKDYGRLWLETGTTQNSTARGRGYNHSWFQYNNLDIDWHICWFHRFGQSNGKVWFKIDVDTADDPTDKAVGWRADAGALKGIVHDGTSLHVVDLNFSLSDYATIMLFLKFIQGSKIEWYVNGEKKGESTNIPTNQRQADVYCVFAVKNTEAAANLQSGLHSHAWISDFGS